MRRRFLNVNNTDAFDSSLNYLSFTAEQDNSTIALTSKTSPDIKYSLNGGNWILWDYSTITLNTGDVVLMKGDNSSGFSTSNSNYNQFKMTGKIAASGNIMSLLYEEDFEGRLAIPCAYCYYNMFYKCTSLTQAPELPATILSAFCYFNMFEECTSLITAPQLPATKLETNCYFSMFRDCTGLTTAPELPATKLASYCYSYMFDGCISLTTSPTLPATELYDSCYSNMFSGTNVLPDCSNIDFAKESWGGLRGLFLETKVTDADLERILPKNNEGKYCLPATTLASRCYENMFRNCTSLTTAPELPATTLTDYCYQYMFYGCTNLTTVPSILPATKLARNCYYRMFQNCASLTTSPTLPATTLADYCYNGMFSGCTSLTTASALPATKLASNCYSSMFQNCASLTTSPTLPATTLADYCYSAMFNDCASLTTAPELPATTLAKYCYSNMFQGCTLLVTAPELPATTLAENCYQYMFSGCSNLNKITMLATDISASGCLSTWVNGVASTGTFVKHINMASLLSGSSGIPSGWEVKDHITPTECTNLTITADNVIGNDTTTIIHYTAICNGIDYKGNTVNGFVKEDIAVSTEFPQNTSETETVERTITFEFLGVTASTVITQGVWISPQYTVDLNNQWELSSTISNPDSDLYDGVYQSFSNKGVNSKAAIMYIDIVNYTDFDLYIRSYAESTYDYVMVSLLDQTINNNTSYSNSTLVKAHTRGNQKSGNTISDYTKVSFTGIDEGLHRITIVYRKDSSSHSGDDRGYLLIPKNQ